MPRHIANFAHTAKIRERISSTPEPGIGQRGVRRSLNKRRLTDSLFEPPPSYEQLLNKRPSKGLFSRLRRCKSDDDIDQVPEHVIEIRRKAPRGIAPIDDFPGAKNLDPEHLKRFDFNFGFDAFYDDHCYSVEAHNFGEWPMAPQRVGYQVSLL